MAQHIEITTGSNGYSADQVARNALTLEDLIAELQEMIEDGVDPQSKVVIRGYGRGAVYEPVLGAELPEDSDEDYM